MILSLTQSVIIFFALFISAHLLTKFVDFKHYGHAIRLWKPLAVFMFPLCKGNEYNVSSFCLQTANYITIGLYLLCFTTKIDISVWIQTVFIVTAIVVTFIALILSNIMLRKKYNESEDLNNDR